jgi:hypothetical protein
MRAVLEFDLPEDRVDFTQAIEAPKLFAAFREFDEWLRGVAKHGISTPCIHGDSAALVREKLHRILQEGGVNLDDS